MNRKIISFSMILSLLVIFTSCSKLEDGDPLFSIKSAIVNKWEFDECEVMDGSDYEHYSSMPSVSDYSEEYSLDKEGEFTYDLSFANGTYTYEVSTEGKWYLMDDNTMIRFIHVDDDGDVFTEDFRLIRVKSKELVMEDMDGNRFFYTGD